VRKSTASASAGAAGSSAAADSGSGAGSAGAGSGAGSAASTAASAASSATTAGGGSGAAFFSLGFFFLPLSEQLLSGSYRCAGEGHSAEKALVVRGIEEINNEAHVSRESGGAWEGKCMEQVPSSCTQEKKVIVNHRNANIRKTLDSDRSGTRARYQAKF